jgi:hypothetical protein
MAEIEIGPLTDRLSDDEIAELARQMEKLGAGQLPKGDSTEVGTVSDDLDADAVTEFYDRLDSHDVGAEIYLPLEFDGVLEVGGLRVASAPILLEALDEIKEELALDEDEEDEEDEDDETDRRLLEAELKTVWKVFFDGATSAMERKLPLHVKT